MPEQACGRVDWTIPQRCLLLGAAGSGMRTLSRILSESGHLVCGSDTVWGTATPTSDKTADESPADPAVAQWLVWDTMDPGQEFDVCVVSPAIPETAPLYRWAVQQAVPLMTLPQAVGAVFGSRTQVCVAGTHGKSTTSSLLAWMLSSNECDPGVYVGAELAGPPGDTGISGFGRFGSGPLAVLEACEFDFSFLRLRPQHVLLNGIDGDHFDCFENSAAEDAAYQQFLELIPQGGRLFVNASCARSRRVAALVGARTCRWSLDNDHSSDWSGQIVTGRPGWITLRIRQDGREFGEFAAPLWGRHNAENVLAAVAMASHLGLAARQCQEALEEFPGIRRRLEHRGVYREMRMLDDYAHHPTAVTATLEAVRSQSAGGRLRVVLEPHQVRRLEHCGERFVQALISADEVIVLPVFPARERVSEATCHRISQQLAATISGNGTRAEFAENVSAAVSIVELSGQPGDIVLTMGAGTVHQFHDEVHRRFQRDPAA